MTTGKAPEESHVEARCVFDFYDDDGDGYLSKDEFLKALRGGGACPTAAAFDDICLRFSERPDVRDFEAALKELLDSRPTVKRFTDGFRGLSQAGRVDADIIRYLATHYSEALSEEEVEELLLAAAPDSDGLVDVKLLAANLLDDIPLPLPDVG
eukprot:TRINITY_DN90941_c0_g1_i1.p1 TRINITY_DN90941_c0_g1~~TRINITY_DN90941_c0_g1_i1.p1  ORF type:complete len:154 (-),score=43.52 TRINITY_DN90941_c0_g1_i1:149-610(-)